MLCSKWHKKIPSGEEIYKASSFSWQAGWRGGGMGSEVVCKRFAVKQRQWEKNFC